ncbi:MAG: hypothetical protein Q9162_006612 [Coniocarpon cinnabarinum]
MGLVLPHPARQSRILPRLSSELPPVRFTVPAATAAVEQQSRTIKFPHSAGLDQDSSSSETTMSAGDSPSSREPPYSSDRWPQGRSEPSSSYQSLYSSSYPHTPSGLRPAEPGQFSAEPWSAARAEQSRAPGAPPGPIPEVGSAQQLPPPRPTKRPGSPDYWPPQSVTRQRPLLSSSGTWTTQVAVPQPGQLKKRIDGIVRRCQLRVRQQPEVARACGFGERDRRAVDPPPVVELEALRIDGSIMNVEELQLAHFVVQASLWSEDGTADVTTFMQPPRIAARRLLGSLAASPAVAADEHNKKGAYFTFADLSCREAGRFRLKFTLAAIDPSIRVPGGSTALLANAFSETFTVYSPRDFPGMRRSTPLTQALKIQGVAIPARKGRNYPMPRQGEEGPSMQE